jgi:hypothetical protein
LRNAGLLSNLTIVERYPGACAWPRTASYNCLTCRL